MLTNNYQKALEDVENLQKTRDLLTKEKENLILEIEDLQSDKKIILKKSQNVFYFEKKDYSL